MNVIIGEVGTGKTTLCRQLIRRLAEDEGLETHLILDPTFDNTSEFLSRFAEMLSGGPPPSNSDPWLLKEIIKHQLYRKGIKEEKIVVLIIDEGQKIPSFCIEILREFLNYETNDFKLLQIVLFAQQEFVQLLVDHANFSDRVNFFTTLGPMNFSDTRQMIQYRLKQSSSSAKPPSIFTLPAYWVIYRFSKGYPRKIVNLCHQSLLAMIIQNRTRIGRSLVHSCARRSIRRRHSVAGTMLFSLGILSVTALVWIYADIGKPQKTPASAPQSPGSEYVSRHHVTAAPGQKASSDIFPVVSYKKNTPMNSGEPQRETGSNQGTPDALPKATRMPPFILGALTITSGENLNELIRLIHGNPSQEYIESLLTLNPHISELNSISEGTIIQFPALAVAVDSARQKNFRIELGNYAGLAEARDAWASFSRRNKEIRMVAYWNNDAGLRFSIFLKKLFFQEKAAKESAGSLEPLWGKRAKIAADWGDETLFFTDPFFASLGHGLKASRQESKR